MSVSIMCFLVHNFRDLFSLYYTVFHRAFWASEFAAVAISGRDYDAAFVELLLAVVTLLKLWFFRDFGKYAGCYSVNS